MKNIFYLFIMLFATFSYAQNTGLIVGKVMDNESGNTPLVFASMSIKGTSVASQTDLTGLFLIENLEAGDYTLVCSFPGYETQEIKVHVDALQPTELQVSLAASTISLSELASLATPTVRQQEDETLTVLK
ncbi:carboxypeptidase-like regulatory domain-containing protein [Confluentibacter flavum]|nr:carboxypeptidase-like regulatory domain-containing protein [Confluentibacter flavum]